LAALFCRQMLLNARILSRALDIALYSQSLHLLFAHGKWFCASSARARPQQADRPMWPGACMCVAPALAKNARPAVPAGRTSGSGAPTQQAAPLATSAPEKLRSDARKRICGVETYLSQVLRHAHADGPLTVADCNRIHISSNDEKERGRYGRRLERGVPTAWLGWGGKSSRKRQTAVNSTGATSELNKQ
jgi:hypothetical protein